MDTRLTLPWTAEKVRRLYRAALKLNDAHSREFTGKELFVILAPQEAYLEFEDAVTDMIFDELEASGGLDDLVKR